MKRRFLGQIPATISLCLLMMGQSWAGSTIWSPPTTCTSLNCGATLLHTNITSSLTNPGGSVEPFVLQVHSAPQYCMRLDVYNQNARMHVVVVAPNGRIWRNYARSASDLRPLVVIPASTSNVQGWYTVHISLASGVTAMPGAHYNADLAYGRYNSTNPNCANPTPPMLDTAETLGQMAGAPAQTSN